MATANASPMQTQWEDQWRLLMSFLPQGWQAAAKSLRALVRRRAVTSAEVLLRLIFAYAWNDWSLRTTAAWAARMDLVDVSDVALLQRFRHASAWLGYLLDHWFREHGIDPPVARFRLVLTDGSTVQEPGSTTTTWRLHAQWDLTSKRWTGIELTDKHGAESLTRLRLQPGDVVLSDRNFAKPGPLQWVQDQKAYIISRVGWNALR